MTLEFTAPRSAPARAGASPLARAATLAVGLFAYLAFLVTFLFAIGFVGGFAPLTVDAGRAAPLGEALLVNAAVLALFAVQHTIMARLAFKRVWTRIVPPAIERSVFVLATCLVFATIFTQWCALPGMVWELDGPEAWALHALAALGYGLVLLGSFQIDHFALFGLAQTWRHFRGLEAPPAHFEERGLYRRVRHPLMLGFLIAFWATPTMSVGHLFFAAMVTGYILIGTHIEERTLIAEHGEAYRAYRRRVPGILPRLHRAA